MKRLLTTAFLASTLLGMSSVAPAAILYTSAVNMGLGSLVCRMTNVAPVPMPGVDIVIEDGNGVTMNSMLAVTVPGGSTVGLVSTPGQGVARCIFKNVSKGRTRANGVLNAGNL